jgi:hypothetical protein
MPGNNVTISAPFVASLAGRSFEIRLDKPEVVEEVQIDYQLGPQTLGAEKIGEETAYPNIKGGADSDNKTETPNPNVVSITLKPRLADGEPAGTQRTVYLNAVGNLFNLAADANVKLAIDNVILWGLCDDPDTGPYYTTIDYTTDPRTLTASEPGPGRKATVLNYRNYASDVGNLGVNDRFFYIPVSPVNPITNTFALVSVGKGTTFEMLGASEITGNWNTLALDQPEIDAGYPHVGGGVRIYGGEFLMSGDHTKIHHNYYQSGGGGIYSPELSSGNRIIMSGEYAEISFNAGNKAGGGVSLIGGMEASLLGGYFEMSGDHATINNNWSGNGGGGVNVQGAGTTFDMTGSDAEIAHNYSALGGGGVQIVNGATFNMEGIRTKINKNLTSGGSDWEGYPVGGGVKMEQGVFNMIGTSAQINDNKAHMGGGGVYIRGASTFTMDGASAQIANNYRKKQPAYGGGVWVKGDNTDVNTQFILKSGSIFGSIDGLNVVVTGASPNGAFWGINTTGYTGPTGSRTSVPGTPANTLVGIVNNTDGLWTSPTP